MLTRNSLKIAANALNFKIPDSKLTQKELILRIIITRSANQGYGAIPNDFLRFPGLYEFSARIAELRKDFTISSKKVDGKRYSCYRIPQFEVEILANETRKLRNDNQGDGIRGEQNSLF